MVELLREGETKPTVSDVLTRIVASALVRHRPVNANFVDGKIHRFAAANVGLAVAAPSGLVVPVIRDADRKSVQQIAADRADIVSRARDGKLQLADLEGGTFTISNLGMYGIEQFVAVLNPPQVAILAVGSIEERADGDRRRARDRPDDDDDAHVRPPRDRRLRGRRVPARRQGVRRVAGAGALVASVHGHPPGRSAGRQVPPRHAPPRLLLARAQSRRRARGRRRATSRAGGGPGDTVLIAVDDAFPGRRRVVPPVPPRPAGLRVRRRGDAGARDRRRAEPARARDRRRAPRGALRARARRRLPRAEPQRRARATPRSSPSTRSTASRSSAARTSTA